MTRALVIGGGPAGLMAADVMAQAGLDVTVADKMPSMGRKFLMAGKSGLNLTKDEPETTFADAIAMTTPVASAVAGFGPSAVQDFATDLGQPIFTGTTGRVFPKAMKASPLLRAWLQRLAALGVTFKTRHTWVPDLSVPGQFETPDGPVQIEADVTVLALGGASWARLGSDGTWANPVFKQGVQVVPFRASNCGFHVNWSNHMDRFFGVPLKACALTAGDVASRGEAIITKRGIEGGGIYTLAATLQKGGAFNIDLLPDRDVDFVTQKLAKPRGKTSLSNHLRKALGLSPLKIALLREAVRDLPNDPSELAQVIKALPLALGDPFPMDEAISTAGGIAPGALTDRLMLKSHPGVFCAGEMLDWDAPTGGYLLTTCFATGRAAGLGAVAYAGGNARL